MDPGAADNAVTASCTVGEGPVNTSGHRGRRPKKPSFGRDARLARDVALLTVPSPIVGNAIATTERQRHNLHHLRCSTQLPCQEGGGSDHMDDSNNDGDVDDLDDDIEQREEGV